MAETGKNQSDGNAVFKPVTVKSYHLHMGVLVDRVTSSCISFMHGESHINGTKS